MCNYCKNDLNDNKWNKINMSNMVSYNEMKMNWLDDQCQKEIT